MMMVGPIKFMHFYDGVDHLLLSWETHPQAGVDYFSHCFTFLEVLEDFSLQVEKSTQKPISGTYLVDTSVFRFLKVLYNMGLPGCVVVSDYEIQLRGKKFLFMQIAKPNTITVCS